MALQDLRGAAPALSRILESPLSSSAQETEKPSKRYNYEWAFARTERTLSTLLARGRLPERLPEILTELTSLPESEQLRRVSTEDRFADADLARHLLDRGYAIRYENPRKMLHLILLGRMAADACSAKTAGEKQELADLRAEAWGQFANALRINGRFAESEQAFGTALDLFEAGTGSPEIHALLLAQLCPLRSHQRRFAEAIELIEQAAQIYREIGRKHLLGSSLVQKAIPVLYAGRPEEAVRLLEEAIRLIDRMEDPRLFLAAHHNLARCFIDLRQPEEALAIYYQARDLYRGHSDPIILLRAAWQEGQLLREIGHLHNAEAALLRSRRGFLEAGLAFEAALVSVDLAELYRSTGSSDKLRQVIEEAMPVFRALGVKREIFALLRLQEAAEPDEPASS